MLRSFVSKNVRVAACIMAFMVLFIVLFSSSYIAGHVHHHCTGEDCPVCACIHQCESMIRNMGDGVAVFTAVVLPILVAFASASMPDLAFLWGTPVSRKVRLNN